MLYKVKLAFTELGWKHGASTVTSNAKNMLSNIKTDKTVNMDQSLPFWRHSMKKLV